MKPLLLLITVVIFSFNVIADKKSDNVVSFDSTFYQLQDTLLYYSNIILQEPEDSLRLAANAKYTATIEDVLSIPNSFSFPFDGVKSLGKVVSPDGKFRILCWLYPHKSGLFTYNAVIQFAADQEGHSRYMMLRDAVDMDTLSIANDVAVMTNGHWYGSVVFNIIPHRNKKQTIYTLLGWRGSMLGNEKIIDVLTFDSDNNPTFGSTIFNGFKQQLSRIIFKYDYSAYMMLNYTECRYKPSNSKSDKKGKMIVFDRLAPIDNHNMTQLAPASAIIDGIYYNKGKWILSLDISIINE